jgi:hypothetical protein
MSSRRSPHWHWWNQRLPHCPHPRFLIFGISPLNIQLHKVEFFLQQEVDGPCWLGHFTLSRQISPVLSWKTQLCSLGIACNATVFIFKKECLRFLLDPRTMYPCNHSVRFSLVVSRGMGNQFLIPLALMFIATSYIWHAGSRRCQQSSPLSAFSAASWTIILPNIGW